MNKIELFNIVKNHPFTNGLEDSYIDYIAGCAEEKLFTTGDYIMRFQQPADEFYLLLEGQAVLINQLPGRRVDHFETVNAPNVLGWSWLVAPHRWHFDVKAKTPLRSICVHTMCLHGKILSDSDFGCEIYRRFIEVIVDRLQASRLQAMDIYRKPEDTTL